MMSMIKLYYLMIFILLDFFKVNDSAKILILPCPIYSHVIEMTGVGETLAEYDHELHLILPPTFPKIEMFRGHKRIQLLEYEIKYKDFYQISAGSDIDYDAMLESSLHATLIDFFRKQMFGLEEFCTNPFEDEKLLHRIERERYDLALIDAFPTSRCFYILMYRFNIPYVSVTTAYDPWLLRAPALPSFVPFAIGGPPYSSDMTFMERLQNTISLIDWTVSPGITIIEDDFVRKYAPENKSVSVNYLAGKSLLWLLDTDIAIDFARPTMANEINIGGLSTGPAKTLPPDLKKFMDNSPEGVIMASFGSMFALPRRHFIALTDALRKVKLKVILRYPHEPPKNLPNHIKVMKWLPQNDLLGHPNMKLFITHCGANSQFESLYHGVPMLNFPVYSDQPYNAVRADYKGYSKTVNMFNITSGDILEGINEILSNPTYRYNVQKGSNIYRSRRMNPKQRAAYWIQHVLQFGGEHLHSHALDIQWYQYLMLDIIATIAMVIILIVLFIAVCLYSMIRLCIKSSLINKVKAD